MTIGLAVVGLGAWGPNLLRNAAEAKGARVAAICDASEKRLAAVAPAHPGAAAVTRLEDVLKREDVHGVILATPAALHAQHATLALRAGKHVLVEKPMALTVREGEELVRVARECGRVLMTGHTFLYNDSVLKTKELVDAGELGRIYFVNAERLSLGKIRDDVNAMWNLAPHDFAILNFLFGGPPVRVWAKGGLFLPGAKLHDVVFATLEYPGGALAHVHSSWLNPLKIRRMTVVGEKKMLVYDDVSETERIIVYNKSVDSKPFDDPTGSFTKFRHSITAGESTVPQFEFREPLAQEIAEFVRCMSDGSEPRTGAAEALGVLRVLESCQKSLENDGVAVPL